MSIDSNTMSLWVKELYARPFIERGSESKSSENEICRELWTYLPGGGRLRIPANSQGVLYTTKYRHVMQGDGIKK